jgi:hypothetical protein
MVAMLIYGVRSNTGGGFDCSAGWTADIKLLMIGAIK